MECIMFSGRVDGSFNVRPGTSTIEAASKAIELAKENATNIIFHWNDEIVVIVDQDSIPQLVARDIMRADFNLIYKDIGPHCSPNLTAKEQDAVTQVILGKKYKKLKDDKQREASQLVKDSTIKSSQLFDLLWQIEQEKLAHTYAMLVMTRVETHIYLGQNLDTAFNNAFNNLVPKKIDMSMHIKIRDVIKKTHPHICNDIFKFYTAGTGIISNHERVGVTSGD